MADATDVNYPKTALIMDASGSMWAPDASGTTTRMEAAKQAAIQLVDGLPTEQELALLTYGTGTGNSDAEKAAGCEDVKTLVPLGGTKQEVTNQISGLVASGYTPIGKSLLEAEKEVSGSGASHIVLISDGIDTCAPPPVTDIAREIRDRNPDLTIDVVGLDVDSETRSQLQGIADAGGGTYSDAGDATSLLDKLTAGAPESESAATETEASSSESESAATETDTTVTPSTISGAATAADAPALELGGVNNGKAQPQVYNDSLPATIKSGAATPTDKELHWAVELKEGLTGEKVLGIGDASGMFPIDTQTQTYHKTMLAQFDQLVQDKDYPWQLSDILPQVLSAGKTAGKLTALGAKLLDPSGNLQAGIAFCPPEGDAGTGMVATNSIKPKTGNISAGTSAFAMIVLDKTLSRVYEQLDMVTTPAGKLVAMAHANNCTTDINAWLNLFGESLQAFGVQVSTDKLYETLLLQALKAEPDCGGLLAYGFYSGEHGVGLSEGCPLFLHPTNANFNLANFIRVHLYSAFGAMKLGMDILMRQEKVEIKQILGHGGIFKTQGVAQKVLASALNIPVATMETAGEGGAWGIALLAAFLTKAAQGKSLEQYLDEEIFNNTVTNVVEPDAKMQQGIGRSEEHTS